MRIRLLFPIFACVFLLAACMGKSSSNEDTVATQVSQAVAATLTAVSPATTVINNPTAVATVSSTVNPSPVVSVPSTSVPQPSATVTSAVESPTAVSASPTPLADAIGTPTESPVDRLAAAGYYPFEVDEISIMINPNLVPVEAENASHDTVDYHFTGEHNRVLDFDISIRKDETAENLITDEAAKAQFANFVRFSSLKITSSTVIGSDATSINGLPGRALRYQYATQGTEGYGVYMLIADGTWLYSFDIAGPTDEHATDVEIITSIFDSASLHGAPGSS
jgi:hypothetical protein